MPACRRLRRVISQPKAAAVKNMVMPYTAAGTAISVGQLRRMTSCWVARVIAT